MRILKHQWVSLGENVRIFSLDINPNGERFATGGQSLQSGRIIIWNFAPLLDEEDEDNPNVSKMLCQIDNHTSCVNIVRWSCDGQFLASGDDELVMVWKLSEEPSSSRFGEKRNVENWKCIARLKGHLGDIFDLAWAPNNCFLATASADNTVVIWNARNFPEKVTVLRHHVDMVKGVTWDPLGQYLATQSADRTLRIWRTADWRQEEVVSECFTDCSATTHILRLAWSPEGQYLVSAHAMVGGGPAAQIIDRDEWKQERSLIGPRKAVTCVKFNPNVLKKTLSRNYEPYCCCAVGSRDCSLSIWNTTSQRPLVSIRNLFHDSILDIAWSSNGLHLLACSLDGTTALLDFSPNEMGIPLSLDEKNSLYEQIYGQSWNQHAYHNPNLDRNKMDVDDIGSKMKQTERQLKNGRRRITAVNLSKPAAPSIPQIACSSAITGDDPSVVCIISGDFNVEIQVTNAFQVSKDLFLPKIERFQNHKSMWEVFLKSSVKCITANEKMVVACCEDFTVNCFFVNCGSQIWSPMLLEDVAVSLTLNANSVCLVVTKSGFMHMWNFETETSILNQISLQTLLSDNSSIKEYGLSECGYPVVTLADERVYSYSLGFKTWMEGSNQLVPSTMNMERN